MSCHRAPRLPKDIRAALDECGRPRRLEKGSKHWHLIVDNRMVSIVSQGSNSRKEGHGSGLMRRRLTELKRTLKRTFQ